MGSRKVVVKKSAADNILPRLSPSLFDHSLACLLFQANWDLCNMAGKHTIDLSK